LTAVDVDRALDERELVVTWLNRGTLHLVDREDYAWLQTVMTPPLFKPNSRRLTEEGVTPSEADRAVKVIERSLAEQGPLTRRQLGERIAPTGVRTEGQALLHCLMLACLRGHAVRGPMAGAEQAYALTRDWLGPSGHVDRARALAELARRYLVSHAPASDRDLAKWTGLPLRDARTGLSSIAAELDTRPDGLLELKASPSKALPLPPPRMLGQYEPVLLGWTSRADILGEHHEIVTTNGLFRPFALVAGKAAGIWSRRDGKIALEPFAPLPTGVREALDADADDIRRFFA
jgi:Winged helix DNA-binding domain